MIFAIAFFLNAATNFAFGLLLSSLLGPAEFGRYSTVQLAAVTMAGGMLDWLRYSTLRFAGDDGNKTAIASTLDAAYFTLMLLAYAAAAVSVAFGATFGLGATLVLLTPMVGVAMHRVDFTSARFRARDEPWPFAGVYALRQAACFTLVLAVAYETRNAAATVTALAAANLVPGLAFAYRARVAGAALRKASFEQLKQFFVYAKPIVLSLVVYQIVALINRHIALAHLGAEPTGRYSLATDLGLRLFGACNSLPELMLFQIALRLDRTHGRAAAEAQLGRNVLLSVGFLAPMAVGWAVMAPTFEALLAPAAFRGSFATVSAAIAPGYFAQFVMISGVNPIFQLHNATWRLSGAALVALVVDVALVNFTSLSQSLEGLAFAYSLSLIAALIATSSLALAAYNVRPRLRDLVVIAAACAAMAALVHPLNALAWRPGAAALAVFVGGATIGAAYVAFDVAGARGFVLVAARRIARRLRPRAGYVVGPTLSGAEPRS